MAKAGSEVWDQDSTEQTTASADVSVDSFGQVLGNSETLQQAVRRARLLCKVTTPVLLQGETGVGKEVFARAIHEGGAQRGAPFVAVNCGGLPRDLLASELFGYTDGAFTGARRSGAMGKLEAAHGGTLFLDEILDMPLELQPYLLRVLEDGVVYPLGSTKPRQFSFRVIAACNRDPWREVTAGRFRMDLFYRIAATNLRIPPLRERADDIPLLIEHFLGELAQRDGFAPHALSDALMSRLVHYPWPGNVRELRNFIESTVLLAAAGDGDGAMIDDGMLPALMQGPGAELAAPDGEAAPMGLKRAERDAIGAALRARGGNLTQVARELRIARSTLYLKVKKYGLDGFLSEMRTRTEE